MQKDSRHTIDKMIDQIFMLLMILSVIALLLLMGAGLYCCVYAVFNDLDVNKLLKGIEFIFIAPLPLLIGSAFYKMYTKTIKRTVIGIESNVDFERDQIMVDLTITKYLFTSTIISTLLVILIEFLYRMIQSKDPDHYYTIIILGLVLLGMLIFYITRISSHLDHKIKDSKDSIQKRVIDTFKRKKIQLKDQLDPDQDGGTTSNI
jgi:uncharacterized membrane protein (DUF373 family)